MELGQMVKELSLVEGWANVLALTMLKNLPSLAREWVRKEKLDVARGKVSA
jgi:hypothetical protein